jgi:ferrochelatase
MRYGNPGIDEVLNKIIKNGCSKLLLVPLYPQYSASTTATVKDEVFKWMLKQRWQPDIRTIPPWFDDQNYIKALANTVKSNIKDRDEIDTLVISFHGIPKRYFMAVIPITVIVLKLPDYLKKS